MPRPDTRAAASASASDEVKSRWWWLACLYGLPVLLAVVLGALQEPVAPLGDDWIFFSHFDHIDLLPASGSGESAILTNATEPDGLRFRPLAYGHMWLERRAFPGSFAVNSWIGILYVGLAGSALVYLLRALELSRPVALLGGLLFVVHPAQAEVYGWASARIDTMAACFGLTAVGLVVRRRLVPATALFAAAFLSKESAYPLVLLPPLLTLLERHGPRAALLSALPGLVALAGCMALKVLLVGDVFAASWSAGIREVPLGARLGGYLSYALPLLLQPASSHAPGWCAWALGVPFTAALLLALLLPIRGVLLSSSPHRSRRARRPHPLRPTLGLLAGMLLSLAVTFGVPVGSDLAGGRLWFLPSAFLCGTLVVLGARWPLWIALLPACLLLYGNLAPYRSANHRMRALLDRLDVEVAQPGQAVRVTELEHLHGPVPLFAFLPHYFHETVPGPPERVARVLLTTDKQRADDPKGLAALDRAWRAEMKKRQLAVLELRWDARTAQLRP